MNATLTIKKDDLLKKLDDRIKEIHDHFDTETQKLQDIIDLREKINNTATAHADWYKRVSEGIADGSIVVQDSGKLKGAPPKPGTKSYMAEVGGIDEEKVDPDTLARAKRYGYYDNERIQSNIDQMRRHEKEWVKEVETAADMIKMSTNETVEVNTADYQKLLTTSLGSRHYYY